MFCDVARKKILNIFFIVCVLVIFPHAVHADTAPTSNGTESEWIKRCDSVGQGIQQITREKNGAAETTYSCEEGTLPDTKDCVYVDENDNQKTCAALPETGSGASGGEHTTNSSSGALNQVPGTSINTSSLDTGSTILGAPAGTAQGIPSDGTLPAPKVDSDAAFRSFLTETSGLDRTDMGQSTLETADAHNVTPPTHGDTSQLEPSTVPGTVVDKNGNTNNPQVYASTGFGAQATSDTVPWYQQAMNSAIQSIEHGIASIEQFVADTSANSFDLASRDGGVAFGTRGITNGLSQIGGTSDDPLDALLNGAPTNVVVSATPSATDPQSYANYIAGLVVNAKPVEGSSEITYVDNYCILVACDNEPSRATGEQRLVSIQDTQAGVDAVLKDLSTRTENAFDGIAREYARTGGPLPSAFVETTQGSYNGQTSFTAADDTTGVRIAHITPTSQINDPGMSTDSGEFGKNASPLTQGQAPAEIFFNPSLANGVQPIGGLNQTPPDADETQSLKDFIANTCKAYACTETELANMQREVDVQVADYKSGKITFEQMMSGVTYPDTKFADSVAKLESGYPTETTVASTFGLTNPNVHIAGTLGSSVLPSAIPGTSVDYLANTAAITGQPRTYAPQTLSWFDQALKDFNAFPNGSLASLDENVFQQQGQWYKAPLPAWLTDGQSSQGAITASLGTSNTAPMTAEDFSAMQNIPQNLAAYNTKEYGALLNDLQGTRGIDTPLTAQDFTAMQNIPQDLAAYNTADFVNLMSQLRGTTETVTEPTPTEETEPTKTEGQPPKTTIATPPVQESEEPPTPAVVPRTTTTDTGDTNSPDGPKTSRDKIDTAPGATNTGGNKQSGNASPVSGNSSGLAGLASLLQSLSNFISTLLGKSQSTNQPQVQPTISLSSSTYSVSSGQQATIAWTSMNWLDVTNVSCVVKDARGVTIDKGQASGTVLTPPLNTATTFAVYCSSPSDVQISVPITVSLK